MEDETELLPVNTYDLIDQLDKQYPHRCIEPGESLDHAHWRAGWRGLIDALIQIKAEEIEAHG